MRESQAPRSNVLPRPNVQANCQPCRAGETPPTVSGSTPSAAPPLAASPRRAGAGRPRPLERGAHRAAGKSAKRFLAASSCHCDLGVGLLTTGASVRLASVVQAHPYSPRPPAEREHELKRLSRPAEAGRSDGQCRCGAFTAAGEPGNWRAGELENWRTGELEESRRPPYL